MNLHYTRINPSGNITLLVTDLLPREDHSAIARLLMQIDPTAEQVGFMEMPTMPCAAARLQMMGGEFCGNATMSMAAWLARHEGLPEGKMQSFLLEVSGADELLPCHITRSGSCFFGTVPMPLPRRMVLEEILPGVQVPVVHFDGISHAILAHDEISPAQAEKCIAQLCARMNAEAMGLLFTDAQFSCLRPLVYVKSTDSAVWENSCGSGTAAIGAWRAYREKTQVRMEIRQPCPETSITVEAARRDETVRPLLISGRVRMEGDFVLEL